MTVDQWAGSREHKETRTSHPVQPSRKRWVRRMETPHKIQTLPSGLDHIPVQSNR
jgi:hypothetical protein